MRAGRRCHRRPFLDGSCWRHHHSEKARQRGPPAPELPGGAQHRAQVGDVHLHGAHLGGGPGGQQRGAHGLGPAPVPARQAQVQPVVLLQQPLAQRSADTTGLERNGINHTVPSTPVSPVRARRTGSGGGPAADRAHSPARPGDQDHLPHLRAPPDSPAGPAQLGFLPSPTLTPAAQSRRGDTRMPRPIHVLQSDPGSGIPRLLWRHRLRSGPSNRSPPCALCFRGSSGVR